MRLLVTVWRRSCIVYSNLSLCNCCSRPRLAGKAFVPLTLSLKLREEKLAGIHTNQRETVYSMSVIDPEEKTTPVRMDTFVSLQIALDRTSDLLRSSCGHTSSEFLLYIKI